MVGEELTQLDSKVSSVQAHCTTTESKHSKQKYQQSITRLSEERATQFKENNTQKDQQLLQFIQQKAIDQYQNRLFTFMDQRDKQKRIIQSFIFKQQEKRHKQNQLANKCDKPILTAINLQSKKREQIQKDLRFINGLFQTNVPKSAKSTSRLPKIIQSKTPKGLAKTKIEGQSALFKSKSKTPLLQEKRSVTPKYKKDQSKSNFESDFILNGFLHKYADKYERTVNNQPILPGNTSEKVSRKPSIKSLLKRKKQLEKQLTNVKQTIITQRKKNNVSFTSNSKRCTKMPKGKQIKNKK